MDIPALSMAMSKYNTMSNVGIAMLDKALELNKDMGEQMVQMMDRSMELSVNPYVGSNFDVSV